jgi:hypothetical protein
MKTLALIAALLLLAACAPMRVARIEPQSWTACDGKAHTMVVTEFVSDAPWVDCPRFTAQLGGEWHQVAMMAFGALACSLWRNDFSEGWVILPPWAPQWMRDHEYSHITRGEYHPALLPFIDLGCNHG